jgi:hypothetical protein
MAGDSFFSTVNPAKAMGFAKGSTHPTRWKKREIYGE